LGNFSVRLTEGAVNSYKSPVAFIIRYLEDFFSYDSIGIIFLKFKTAFSIRTLVVLVLSIILVMRLMFLTLALSKFSRENNALWAM